MGDRLIPVIDCCRFCLQPLPENARDGVKYCNDTCKKAQRAWERREERAKKRVSIG